MENKLLCYVCKGGQLAKDTNGVVEYEGGQIIPFLVNVHISYAEFVSMVCDLLKVHTNSVKLYCTCKFELLMMVLLCN